MVALKTVVTTILGLVALIAVFGLDKDLPKPVWTPAFLRTQYQTDLLDLRLTTVEIFHLEEKLEYLESMIKAPQNGDLHDYGSTLMEEVELELDRKRVYINQLIKRIQYASSTTKQ